MKNTDISNMSPDQLEKLVKETEEKARAVVEKMTPEEQRQAEIEGQRMAEERINDLQAILDQAKKVAEESRPKPRFCGNCGAPVDGGRFCSNCGSAL